MDVTTVASQLVEVLAPFLPFLVHMGQEAAEQAGRQLSADAWDDAKALWDRLAGRLEERPAAAEAVQDVTEAPEDEDARAALRLQLRKLWAGTRRSLVNSATCWLTERWERTHRSRRVASGLSRWAVT
jgi:hypothetical protein